MREMHTAIDAAETAIREIRTADDPAVQRLVAAASSLSDLIGRLTRERVGA